MLKDAQGLVVTTDSPLAIAAINRFTQEALSYGQDAEAVLFQGNAADRQCALIHAYTAAYYLSQEEASSRRWAEIHLKAAHRRLNEITERERWFVQAIAAWAAGDISQAILLQETIVQQYPQDLLAVQQAQYHYFYQGDMARLLQVAEQVLPDNPGNHYLYGMVAFGLEQCGRFAEAETMAHQAIAINRDDPWAHHTIAHVLDAQGRIAEGIAWMERHADTWETCNSMLYTHNWWHIALYYLAERAFQKVLQLYDLHIWGRARKDSPKDQVGAIATLVRLELQGVDVGARWQALSPHLALRLHEHALPFQDLHYVYALARIGNTNDVTEMVQSMKTHAQERTANGYRVWTEVVIPAAQGIIAHAMGSWSEAIHHLDPVLPRLQEIGGSHTQRELFHQIYRDALQKKHQRVTVSASPTSRSKRKRKPLSTLPLSSAKGC